MSNKKIILSIVGGLILILGFGYTNCGDTKYSTENSSSNPLPAGMYTAELKDGTKIEIRKTEPVKYTITFKDGTEVEFLGNPIK